MNKLSFSLCNNNILITKHNDQFIIQMFSYVPMVPVFQIELNNIDESFILTSKTAFFNVLIASELFDAFQINDLRYSFKFNNNAKLKLL